MTGERAVVVGLAGVTCGGKTSLAARLVRRYPDAQLLSLDDYFHAEDDPRHVLVPGLEHFNWDTLGALDMDRLCGDVARVLADTSRLLLIAEGFLVLNDARVRRACDLMYCVTLPRDACWQRRQDRVYDPPDVPGYFDKCVWPMYQKYLQELRRDHGDVVYLDGERSLDQLEEQIVADVEATMKRR